MVLRLLLVLFAFASSCVHAAAPTRLEQPATVNVVFVSSQADAPALLATPPTTVEAVGSAFRQDAVAAGDATAGAFHGWSIGLAGLLLVMSSFVSGWRMTPFAIVATIVILFGPALGIPEIGIPVVGTLQAFHLIHAFRAIQFRTDDQAFVQNACAVANLHRATQVRRVGGRNSKSAIPHPQDRIVEPAHGDPQPFRFPQGVGPGL